MSARATPAPSAQRRRHAHATVHARCSRRFSEDESALRVGASPSFTKNRHIEYIRKCSEMMLRYYCCSPADAPPPRRRHYHCHAAQFAADIALFSTYHDAFLRLAFARRRLKALPDPSFRLYIRYKGTSANMPPFLQRLMSCCFFKHAACFYFSMLA